MGGRDGERPSIPKTRGQEFVGLSRREKGSIDINVA